MVGPGLWAGIPGPVSYVRHTRRRHPASREQGMSGSQAPREGRPRRIRPLFSRRAGDEATQSKEAEGPESDLGPNTLRNLTTDNEEKTKRELDLYRAETERQLELYRAETDRKVKLRNIDIKKSLTVGGLALFGWVMLCAAVAYVSRTHGHIPGLPIRISIGTTTGMEIGSVAGVLVAAGGRMLFGYLTGRKSNAQELLETSKREELVEGRGEQTNESNAASN